MCRSEVRGKFDIPLIKSIDSKKEAKYLCTNRFLASFIFKLADFGGVLGERRSFTKKVSIHWQR
jgi:hypothetical protein